MDVDGEGARREGVTPVNAKSLVVVGDVTPAAWDAEAVTALPAGSSSFAVGDIRLTLIPDGYHRCDPVETFAGSTAADWDEHSHLLDEHGRLVMTMGALLAELPSGERVLIDAASGHGP